MDRSVIKVDLSKFFETNDLRSKALIFVNPEWKVVECLQNRVKKMFNIDDIQFLTKDGYYISPDEPAQILHIVNELRGISGFNEPKVLANAGNSTDTKLPRAGGDNENKKTKRKRKKPKELENSVDENCVHFNEAKRKKNSSSITTQAVLSTKSESRNNTSIPLNNEEIVSVPSVEVVEEPSTPNKTKNCHVLVEKAVEEQAVATEIEVGTKRGRQKKNKKNKRDKDEMKNNDLSSVISVPSTKTSKPVNKSTATKHHLFFEDKDEDENKSIQNTAPTNIVEEANKAETLKICLQCTLNEDTKPRVFKIPTMKPNQKSPIHITDNILIAPVQQTDMSSTNFDDDIETESTRIAKSDSKSIVETKEFENRDALENSIEIAANNITDNDPISSKSSIQDVSEYHNEKQKDTKSQLRITKGECSLSSDDEVSSVVIDLDGSEYDDDVQIESTMDNSMRISNILPFCTNLNGLPKVDDFVLFKTLVKGSATKLTDYLAGICKSINKRTKNIQLLITDGLSEIDKIEKLYNVHESETSNYVTLKFDKLVDPKVYTVN